MKKITFLLAMLTFSFGFSQNGGVDCASAVVVTEGAVTGTTLTDTTVGLNADDFAWFAYTATADGTLIVTSCGGGSDTEVRLYDDCAGAVLIENDDFCDLGNGDLYASQLEWPVVNGTTYYIQWTDEWELGPFDWEVAFLGCAPPAATVAVVDDCINSEFSIDVDITDLGGNGVLSITNTFDAGVVAVDMGINIYTAGPFPAGTPVAISIVGDNMDCTVSSAPLSDTCPPSNDECAGAIPVVCDGNYLGSTAAGTDSGGNSNGATDVWYSYTGSGTAEDVTIDLCASAYDTAVRVYTDCSVTAGAQIAFNDDSCGTQSNLTFASDGTTTYYIMVEGWNTSSGAFDMTITCAVNIPAPANDLCANAEPLALDTTVSGTTAGATDSSTGATDDTTCQPFSFKSDVWYSFVAPTDGDVGIRTTITGSSDQANVAVYPSCGQLDTESLGCSDGNGGETLNLTGLTGMTTYYVRVWSDGVAARQAAGSRIEGTFSIVISDATLTTEEFDVNPSVLSYYPNPVSNMLTLKAQQNIQDVAVYNMLGQEVLRLAPNTVSSEVNMTSLQSGAYFVKVMVANTTQTIRIIKN